MVVTDPTFHNEMSLLNEVAVSNMEAMLVTELTFQPPIFWLNADAPANM